MGARDPDKPQLDFPELVAEIITQLRLTGQVGLLSFSDQVVPTFLIGSRGVDFAGSRPAFASPGVFSSASVNPPLSSLILDTGPLPAGTYDAQANLSYNGVFAVVPGFAMQMEHRDAANAVTLAGLLILPASAATLTMSVQLPLLGYVLGVNERIRVVTGNQGFVGGVSTNLFIQRRPTP